MSGDQQQCQHCFMVDIDAMEQRIASLEAENKALKQCDTNDQAKFKAMVTMAFRLFDTLKMDYHTQSPADVVERVATLSKQYADSLDTIEAMLRAAMPNGDKLSIDEMEAESNAHSTKPSEYIAYALARERRV